jgi:site-specific recombinase XerD
VATVIAPSTIGGKIQTIKNFLKFVNFIYDVGLTYTKIESPKVKYPTIEPLSREEIQNLLRYVRRIELQDIDRLRSELLIMIAFTS